MKTDEPTKFPTFILIGILLLVAMLIIFIAWFFNPYAASGIALALLQNPCNLIDGYQVG